MNIYFFDVRIHINVDEEEENDDEKDAEGLFIELPESYLDFNLFDQQLDNSLRNFEGDNFELLSDDDE